MNVQILKFPLLLCALILLQACDKDDMDSPDMMEEEMMEEEDNTIYYSGDVIIDDTVRTESRQKVVVEPGTHITFGPGGILVANGDLIVEGTESDPIYITGSQELVSQRVIQVRWDSDEFILNNAVVEDGLITSVATWNHISDAKFINTKQLEWSDALIRFWYSSLLVENCEFVGINRGDGVLVHNMESPIVRNCDFFQTPDAVEYINCNNGLISSNIFTDCSDDGIDQNGCFNTMIRDNEFYNIADRALEIGSEGFGRSDSIKIINNLFVDCNVAVNVRQSSSVKVQNSTFYNTRVVLDFQTDMDSIINSSGIMESSVISNTTDENILLSGLSTASVQNCMSDEELDQGISNIVSEIQFVDPTNHDYRITQGLFPQGYDANTIGYQRQ